MSAITDSHTLDRICIDGVCHCDWRLTLQNCVESQAMTIIHGINIGISGMAVILGKRKYFLKSHFMLKLSFVYYLVIRYRLINPSSHHKGPYFF
jgi:hypothetical protein